MARFSLFMDDKRIRNTIAVLSLAVLSCFAQSRDVTDWTPIRIEGIPATGDPQAAIALVEFSDYQCPLSSRHFSLTLRRLLDEFVKTGKVRYYFRDYPLESIHPLAFKAAEGAHCAGEQGKFWELHDRLLRNQGAIGAEALPLHALMLGLDVPKFQQCIDSGRYAARIRESVAQAKNTGIRGTPGFILALTHSGDSELRPLVYIDGAQPYEVFAAAITRLLAETAAPSTER
jgi:protein-disulfide isomerase